jgi:hypothetical protein
VVPSTVGLWASGDGPVNDESVSSEREEHPVNTPTMHRPRRASSGSTLPGPVSAPGTDRPVRIEERHAKRSKAAYISSAIVATAAVVASVGGLAIKGLYRDGTSWATAALRGGDLVTLVVAVPILVVALVLASRGSSRARLVWIGMLAYMVYNFAFYVFGAALNDLFLVHVVAFSASIFALIATMTSEDASAVARRFRAPALVRAVAALLVVVGVVFAALWSGLSISYAVTGRLSLGAATLEGMHTVFAIDLSLMVPGMVLAGVLLWRRNPWGFVSGTAMSVFGAVYQLNLAAAGWFQANAGVEGVKRIDPVGAAFIAVFLLASVVMIRELRPSTGQLSR